MSWFRAKSIETTKVWSYEIKVFVEVPEDPDGSEGFQLRSNFLINDEFGIGWDVDLHQLRKATEAEGEYYIWVCGCGSHSCALLAHDLKVAHRGSQVVFCFKTFKGTSKNPDCG